jgi:hypothetical protein
MSIYVDVTPFTSACIAEVAVATGKPAETVAQHALAAAMREFPTKGRYMVVHGPDLDTLEQILGRGSILNSTDLRSKVERLAGITYGNIRFNFSPGQLEEIARRAERLSMTPERLIRQTVTKMEELFFTHLGVGAGG